jgi:serine protease Do
MTRKVKITLLASALALGGAITMAAASNGGGAMTPAPTTSARQTRSEAQAASNAVSPAPTTVSDVTPKTQAPPEAKRLSHAFAATARAMSPSVVRLDVEMGARTIMPSVDRQFELPPELRRFFGSGEGWQGPAIPQMPMPARGTGSGIIVDQRGDILTNGHVVDGATKVNVQLADGREFPGKVVGRDSETDVAVVRMEKPPGDLVAARLGNSDAIEVGDWVLAIGSPLGMDQTVTAGIVSGKGAIGRHGPEMSGALVRSYIQTDAKINPGNSGGPLVNLEGEVIGVNTQISTGPGGAYGFAIPINQAHHVADLLIKDGRVHYAYLGVTVGNVPENAGGHAGAVVREVVKDGPADRAGLVAGDVITAIGDHKVGSAADVVGAVAAMPVGETASLTYERNGKAHDGQVTLAERPRAPGDDAFASAAPSDTRVGVALQTLTPEVAQQIGVDPATKGAVITDVVPQSRAAKAGLAPADVILDVNRKPVASADEAATAIRQSGKNADLLRVRRGDSTRFVTIAAS